MLNSMKHLRGITAVRRSAWGSRTTVDISLGYHAVLYSFSFVFHSYLFTTFIWERHWYESAPIRL